MLYFATLCFVALCLPCCALSCCALPRCALLCCALPYCAATTLYFAMLCCARMSIHFLQACISIPQQQKPAVLFFTAPGPALWQHHQHAGLKGCDTRPCRRRQGFWDHQGHPQERGWVPAVQPGTGGSARAVAGCVARRKQNAGGCDLGPCWHQLIGNRLLAGSPLLFPPCPPSTSPSLSPPSRLPSPSS